MGRRMRRCFTFMICYENKQFLFSRSVTICKRKLSFLWLCTFVTSQVNISWWEEILKISFKQKVKFSYHKRIQLILLKDSQKTLFLQKLKTTINQRSFTVNHSPSSNKILSKISLFLHLKHLAPKSGLSKYKYKTFWLMRIKELSGGWASELYTRNVFNCSSRPKNRLTLLCIFLWKEF